MKSNLWQKNTPQNFWQCQTAIDETIWWQAIQNVIPMLDLPVAPSDQASLAAFILSEERFGEGRWELSLPKKIYYQLKSLLPRPLIKLMRQSYSKQGGRLNWHIEDRYPRFLWEVMQQILLLTGKERVTILDFWPASTKYAFVLTHDIETAKGQAFVRRVAELETDLGFRSSFNFVPERYTLDEELIQELKEKGFEVGMHGLKHDGKLFFSRSTFERRAKIINKYLEEYGVVGYRSPLMHRNPYWLQLLNIEYDLSFFDTDPFEPILGGTMSIWPFQIGKFIELPYTLPQDYTLVDILDETSPKIWLEKVDFIEKYHGMVLVNVHPDYLLNRNNWDVYEAFLSAMKKRNGYWHALPKEIASWWRQRMEEKLSLSSVTKTTVSLDDNRIVID
jgi:peptidoglycan/xylan/chitin deacetylase (PgdA/CDA1 family)